MSEVSTHRSMSAVIRTSPHTTRMMGGKVTTGLNGILDGRLRDIFLVFTWRKSGEPFEDEIKCRLRFETCFQGDA